MKIKRYQSGDGMVSHQYGRLHITYFGEGIGYEPSSHGHARLYESEDGFFAVWFDNRLRVSNEPTASTRWEWVEDVEI